MDRPFAPYEGTEPYIFVSYSHKDSDQVLPVLTELNRAGYRIWYDEGIPWVSEWPAVIEEHLDRCAVCLAFLSPASVESKHFRREIHCADGANKPVFSVYLEKTQLKHGLRMQLSLYQYANFYDYANIGDFVDRLKRETFFDPCRPNNDDPTPPHVQAEEVPKIPLFVQVEIASKAFQIIMLLAIFMAVCVLAYDYVVEFIFFHPLKDFGLAYSESAFGTVIAKDRVSSITFLNTTEIAPKYAHDFSPNGNRSMLVWTKKNGGSYNFYIAGDGGIVAPVDSKSLFQDYKNVQQIHFNSAFHTESVTDMSYMFYNCGSLTALDVSGFDTANATTMERMFDDCRKLNTLNLSGFNTANVTDMSGMFHNCGSLTELDVKSFDTVNVTNMSGMFHNCGSLTELDVKSFDTANVTNMSSMFSGCGNLMALEVSGFNTSKITNMWSMFNGCGKLNELHVSGFDTSNVTNMGRMFSGCGGLTALEVSGFDTSKITNMLSMFDGCGDLTALDVSGFDTSNVTNMSYMFFNCGGLTALDVSGFDTANVTNMLSMFNGCGSLTTIYASDRFVTEQVKDTDRCFYRCTSLVGGNGTAYNLEHNDASYARIDAAGTPGYFTAKE